MYSVYETISRKRRCVSGSRKIAQEFVEALGRAGIRAFWICA